MNHENTSNILNKFTYHFKKVLISAQNLALTKKHARIESDDVLLSLISAKGSLGSDILIKQNQYRIFKNYGSSRKLLYG